MKTDTVSGDIQTILSNTGWSQASLARKLGVSQSTVSKWLDGTTAPSDDEQIQVVHTLAEITSEKALLLGARMMASIPKWHFLCARSSVNKSSQRENAIQTFGVLKSAIQCALSPQDHACPSNRFGFLFSIVALPVPFADRSKAFIFADDLQKPRNFIILVNSELDPQTQMAEAIAEIGAHVRPYVFSLNGQAIANEVLI